MPLVRPIRPGDAEAIKLPGTNPFEPDVPDVSGLVPRRVEDDGAGRRGVRASIEQVEAHTSSVPAEDCEVDAGAPQVGSEGKRRPRTHRLNLARLEKMLQLVELLEASRLLRHAYMKGNWCTSCFESGLRFATLTVVTSMCIVPAGTCIDARKIFGAAPKKSAPGP